VGARDLKPNTTRIGVVLKTFVRKEWLLTLLLAVAFILAACGGAGGGQQDSGSGGMAGMDHSQMGHGSMGMGSGGMAKQMIMGNGKYSDRRFINAMVPHHQGAIAMAEVTLKNAEHEEIIQLSQNIISSQQAEIEELKSIKQEDFGTSNVPMEMSQEQMRGMGMMMDPQQLANQEPFDEAFIDAMIPHHQSAIEMAQVALEKSDNPKIKELAENIISAQQREIEQMREWRREWYPQG
jgi:uncharacterized protein (DUF305 family)